MQNKKFYIMIIAIVLGALIVTQMRSFSYVNTILIRDAESNVFQEIKILKDKNKDLLEEVSSLTNTLEQLQDTNSALYAIDEEINKYKKLTGGYPVFGPGVQITVDEELTTPWVIDLINEFFNSSAQAVSINDVRITNQTLGFDTLPQGQMLLNGAILAPPYNFSVIGEPSLILSILELPGGIFDRLEANFPKIEITSVQKEIIKMN